MSDWPETIRKLAEEDRAKEKEITLPSICLSQRVKIVLSALEQGREVKVGSTDLIMSEDNQIGIKATREVNDQAEEVVLLFDYNLNTFLKDIANMSTKDIFILSGSVTLQETISKPERFKEK